MKKEYKVEVIKESAAGTIMFGRSKMPLRKTEKILNRYGADGWNMDFMVIEHRRMLLFWTREAVIVTFSRTL